MSGDGPAQLSIAAIQSSQQNTGAGGGGGGKLGNTMDSSGQGVFSDGGGSVWDKNIAEGSLAGGVEQTASGVMGGLAGSSLGLKGLEECAMGSAKELTVGNIASPMSPTLEMKTSMFTAGK